MHRMTGSAKCEQHRFSRCSVIVTAIWAGIIRAAETASGNQVVVKDRVIHDDLLAAARNVRVGAASKAICLLPVPTSAIAGPVNGYVMSAGRTITLDGHIGNALWVGFS